MTPRTKALCRCLPTCNTNPTRTKVLIGAVSTPIEIRISRLTLFTWDGQLHRRCEKSFGAASPCGVLSNQHRSHPSRAVRRGRASVWSSRCATGTGRQRHHQAEDGVNRGILVLPAAGGLGDPDGVGHAARRCVEEDPRSHDPVGSAARAASSRRRTHRPLTHPLRTDQPTSVIEGHVSTPHDHRKLICPRKR